MGQPRRNEQQGPEHEWAIWRDVPPEFSGVWQVRSRRGWLYLGGFRRGTLIAGVRLNPESDEETKASWLAMLELSLSGHEPKLAPVLPIRPVKVLPFPVTRSSLSAS